MAPEKKGFSDLKLTQKLTLLTALVGAVASLVACGSFIIFELSAPPNEDLSDRLQRYLLLTAMVLLTSSLVTIFVSYRFRRLITDPITVLAHAVAQVAEEGTYLRLQKVGEDEVGSLVTSFNAMMDTLEQKDSDLRESKALFDCFMENSPAFASIKDAESRYLFLNPTGCQLAGKGLVDVLGKRDADLWPAELARQLSTGDGASELVFPGDRSLRLLRFALQNGALGTVGLDETELRATLGALRESEERYELAVRGVNPGIWDWQVGTAEIYLSPRWKGMLGFAEDELENTLETWLARVHKEDKQGLQAAIDAHLRRADSEFFECEYRIQHKDETYLWVLNRAASLRDDEGRVYRMAGSQSDITQQKAAEDRLRHDAFHDTLTGLPNRALFFDRLGRALERTHRNKDYLFAVLFLDLDGFKTINDSLGHLVGDQLLVEISRRLLQVVRSEDTVARLGGDEFTVLLEDISDNSDAIRVADRVHRILKKPFDLGGNEFFPTTSIGIALSSSGYERPEDLLRDADTAMYRAKTSGKANHKIFDLEMHEQALSRLQLESGLRKAVENQEFVVYYQPVITLDTGRIVGFEALVRWNHPEKGLMLPGTFMQIAEDCGFIAPIGEHVLRVACTQLKAWRDSFGPKFPELLVSVNVSVRQFEQPDLVERILQVIEETGAPPNGLRLEVTESALMRDYQTAVQILSRLKDVEIQFYLDDFGTGYSSLNHLRQFPFSTLKVDRSFVGEMLISEETHQVVQTVLRLAQSLGMSSVGEGVETAEQLAELRRLGCQLAQGFLFSKAVPADEATRMLAEDPRW